MKSNLTKHLVFGSFFIALVGCGQKLEFSPKLMSGESYDGKMYGSFTAEACRDGGPRDIIAVGDGAQLIRRDCQDVNPPVQLDSSEVQIAADLSSLIYQEQKFNLLEILDGNDPRTAEGEPTATLPPGDPRPESAAPGASVGPAAANPLNNMQPVQLADGRYVHMQYMTFCSDGSGIISEILVTGGRAYLVKNSCERVQAFEIQIAAISSSSSGNGAQTELVPFTYDNRYFTPVIE